MTRKDNNIMGGALVIIGFFLFIAVVLIIQSLPFEITLFEQSILYIFSIFILLSGLFLIVKN